MAVALIVIEVFISPSGMSSNSVRISPRCETGTPTLPTSPRASRVRVVAGLRRQVEGDREAGLPLGQVAPVQRVDSAADEWPAYVRITHGRSRSSSVGNGIGTSLGATPPQATGA